MMDSTVVTSPLLACLQVDAEENEVRSFFFLSEDALTCDKLLILIHGSGAVRAGQWARRYARNASITRNVKYISL